MSDLPDVNKIQSKKNDRAMWRGTLIPSIATALLALALSSLFAHKAGFYGALLASAVVIIFFSVHLLVGVISKELDPILTMGVAMFSYFAKVLLMAGFLIVVDKATSPATVSRGAFGASAIAIALAWLGGEIRAFTKLKLHLPLPEKR